MKLKLFRTLFLSIFLIALMMPVRPGLAAESQVLVVSPDGPYTSIQDAVDASNIGDTIQVRGGQYAGPLEIDKTLKLPRAVWFTNKPNHKPVADPLLKQIMANYPPPGPADVDKKKDKTKAEPVAPK